MKKALLIFASLFIYNLSFAQPSLVGTEKTSDYRFTQAQEVQKIIQVLENNICNPAWLKGQEWKDLVTELQSPEVANLPLDKFQQTFNRKVKALPFTHVYLKLKNQKDSGKATKAPFGLQAIDKQTALLTIRTFAADAPAMMKLVQQIQSEGYTKLIIDLRENPGGTLDAAVVIGRFLTNEPIDAGVYLTRKWFDKQDRYPTESEIEQFPFLKDMTYPGISKAFAENDAFRMVLPPHSGPVFQGKVAVLTSNNTASACEPFVDVLKNRQIATIVGEKTNGAMLSAYYFDINEDLKLFLPTADFLTAEGNRIDKLGVEPDISVKSEEALDYVLEHLFKQTHR